MKEQLISFDTAKLAKEKGFDWTGKQGWSLKGNLEGYNKTNYPAPTQALLQKWLRENHNIDINVNKDSNEMYHCMVYNNISVCGPFFSLIYEESLEEGLQKALELVK